MGDRVFSENLKQDEYLFRVGGDEFAIIVGDEPEAFLQKSNKQLQEEVTRIGRPGHSGVFLSFGMITVLPQDIIDLKDIYKKADKVLYVAKRNKGSWLAAGDIASLDIDKA